MDHLLGIEPLGREEVEELLSLSESFEGLDLREVKKVPTLRGRTVLNLFMEPSTRTRSSFELAAKRLSADVLNFSASGSSLEKGESFKDTVLTLAAQRPDLIVVRAPWVGAAALVARWSGAHVVNAGDGGHEHPTQALLDLYVLKQRFGRLEGLSVWVVGDIAHSRVARSLVLALVKVGAAVTVCGPPTLVPPAVERLGATVTYTLDGVGEADAVYALRLQRERMAELPLPSLREYASRYQIDRGRLRPGQLLLHAGPVNRGVEVEGRLVDQPQAAVLDQVRAGVAVRMAVLYRLLAGQQARVAAGTAEGVA
jgi:aspartate carbamoyltransferase catalytic subunit